MNLTPATTDQVRALAIDIASILGPGIGVCPEPHMPGRITIPMPDDRDEQLAIYVRIDDDDRLKVTVYREWFEGENLMRSLRAEPMVCFDTDLLALDTAAIIRQWWKPADAIEVDDTVRVTQVRVNGVRKAPTMAYVDDVRSAPSDQGYVPPSERPSSVPGTGTRSPRSPPADPMGRTAGPVPAPTTCPGPGHPDPRGQLGQRRHRRPGRCVPHGRPPVTHEPRPRRHGRQRRPRHRVPRTATRRSGRPPRAPWPTTGTRPRPTERPLLVPLVLRRRHLIKAAGPSPTARPAGRTVGGRPSDAPTGPGTRPPGTTPRPPPGHHPPGATPRPGPPMTTPPAPVEGPTTVDTDPHANITSL